MKTEPIWGKGSMTFTNKYAKPPGQNMDDFLGSSGGRKWVSKKDEVPSDFIFRILTDLENDGAAITDYLIETIRESRIKRRKKS